MNQQHEESRERLDITIWPKIRRRQLCYEANDVRLNINELLSLAVPLVAQLGAVLQRPVYPYGYALGLSRAGTGLLRI